MIERHSLFEVPQSDSEVLSQCIVCLFCALHFPVEVLHLLFVQVNLFWDLSIATVDTQETLIKTSGVVFQQRIDAVQRLVMFGHRNFNMTKLVPNWDTIIALCLHVCSQEIKRVIQSRSRSSVSPSSTLCYSSRRCRSRLSAFSRRSRVGALWALYRDEEPIPFSCGDT